MPSNELNTEELTNYKKLNNSEKMMGSQPLINDLTVQQMTDNNK